MADKKAKNILFCCATGIATSTVAEEKTLQYLKDQGMDNVTYTQTNLASLPSMADPDEVDCVVATTQVPYDLKVPVVHALSLITGIGEEDTLKQVYDILNK